MNYIIGEYYLTDSDTLLLILPYSKAEKRLHGKDRFKIRVMHTKKIYFTNNIRLRNISKEQATKMIESFTPKL